MTSVVAQVKFLNTLRSQATGTPDSEEECII